MRPLLRILALIVPAFMMLLPQGLSAASPAPATAASTAKAAPDTSKNTDRPQSPYLPPVWWFGLSRGVNLNFYGGTTQELNDGFTAVAPFHKGFGTGLFLSLDLEYRPHPVWGGILQVAYDDRRGSFNDVECPCGETETLNARPAYWSIEPSLRVAPFSNAFYLYAGPRVGFLSPWLNTDGFHYAREGFPDVDGDYSQMRQVVYSGQIGVGYDFEWRRGWFRKSKSGNEGASRILVSPFAAWQPHYGQDPRDGSGLVDRWALTTVRVGLQVLFGRPRPAGSIRFTAHAPRNVVAWNVMHETFPLRNYVFFDSGSTRIPDRYAQLSQPQASSFREEALQGKSPRPAGRSARQLQVYHNVLNVLGRRLQQMPGTSIQLVGLSTRGAEQGRARAEAVRNYLSESFGIDPARINVEGRPAPVVTTPVPEDARLLRAENERVEIHSRSSDLLVQIGEGGRFMLKPVQIDGRDAGVDSVVFTARGGETVDSWVIDITNDGGGARRYGPFTGTRAALPALTLLGDLRAATFIAEFTARGADGKPIRRRDTFTLKRRSEGVQKVTRYAVLFDLDEARTVSAYERFLKGTVTEAIPDSSTVYVRGRTDEAGEAAHNLDLSHERAEGVRRILKASTARAGKKNVEFETSWSGEDRDQAPFGNETPEERAYNRTVIIDIVPE